MGLLTQRRESKWLIARDLHTPETMEEQEAAAPHAVEAPEVTFQSDFFG